VAWWIPTERALQGDPVAGLMISKMFIGGCLTVPWREIMALTRPGNTSGAALGHDPSQ
jgi:hypothetical protein